MLTHKSIARTFVLALMGLLLFLPLSVEVVQAQQDCPAKLQQAESEYTNGRFDAALDLVNECLNEGNPGEADRQRALKLQILIYIAKDYIEQAKIAINKLLDLVPMYQPDPDQDQPAFVQIFERVKSERQQRQTGAPSEKKPPKEVKLKKGGGAKWLLIGGGVLVAGAGAALALGGGSGGTTPPPPSQALPTPPPLP
jgi:hypothetical protein